ncbi:hypothetical protein M1M18_gp108 [Halorubrum virus Serpecor1]|uniref:Uncharacterized protein n=1 Tax=Halorubrum virus Serpecor1 TaxID=2721757 RepID=A0A6G9RYT2_9CAUD|nr:hypothetical protein M1M18_gp108 [Halorubrum virus Serpecor1]QIR31192.1 hypothetical protein HrrSp1_135 [Halorubrum virus Serpecor1]
MNCEDSEISFAFIGEDNDLSNPIVEIRPLTMDFQRNMGQFDFVRSKFSQGVAEHIEGAVLDDDGILNRPRPVVIKLGGKPIHRMLYLPDAVMFGVNNVHIELHDVQKYLDRGVVDYQRQNVRLEEAYRYVFNQRDTSDGEMFSGIRFSVPESAFEELNSRYTPGLGPITLKNQRSWDKIRQARRDQTGAFEPKQEEDVIRDLEAENVHNIIDGHYALDFKQVSPWEAILEMNEKFGVTTWVAPDGYLWVGSREATGIDHVTAPDDPRVWKLIDYNITPPRDPIMKVVVRGKQVHDPKDSFADNVGEFVNQSRNILDFRMEGVAERPDLNYGRVITPEDLDAAADGLKEIAKRRLINEQKKQWSGNIELLPSHSGDSWTDIRDVQIGDGIVTIPPENGGGECRNNIQLEKFTITGVHHTLTENGEWTLRLDVVPIADGSLHPDNVKTYNRYFDPTSKEYVDEETYEARKEADKGFQLNDLI